MIRIRRATRADAAAIGRVHVETWQSSYAGLLPDKALAQMSDVRQSAWWLRVTSARVVNGDGQYTPLPDTVAREGPTVRERS